MIDNKENRKEFKTCVEAMFVSLGGEFSDAALLGYWIALSDCELSQVQKACYRAIRESRFVPKPAELREYIFGKVEDRALLAWTDVLKSTPLGCWKHVDFEDRLINATIRSLGGWPDFLARLTPQSEKYARLDFVKTYTAFAANGVSSEACLPLAGLSEAEVHNGQLRPATPKRIACSALEHSQRIGNQYAPGVIPLMQQTA